MRIEAWRGNFHSSKHVWEFPIEDFLVLARPDVPGLYILNASARVIWDIRKAGLAVSDLIRQYATTYDISMELAAEDVTRTLDQWESGVLSPESNPPFATVAADIGLYSPIECFARDYLVQGKNVRVLLHTRELADEIIPRLQSLPSSLSAPDFTFRVVEDSAGFSIFCNGSCVGKEENAGAARAVLFQQIVRSCRDLDWLAVFHAGACGSGSRCVVFPAATQSGKTTLAAVLMKMGWNLYSDDSVLLQRDTLSVPPMPFALMVREGSWDVLCPRFPEFDQLPIVSRYGQRVRFLPPQQANQNGHCAQVAACIFVRFEPHATSEISTLDSMHALLRLQDSGFWVAHDEQSIGAFLAWMQSTPSYSMTYSDVDQAAEIIRALID